MIFLAAAAFNLSALPDSYRTGCLYDNPTVVSGKYTGFCQDKDGFIWIGTSRGLLRFDGNAYDVYRHEDSGEGSLSDSRILDVLCDTSGRIWVATCNGLNLYLPDSDSFMVVPLPNKTFYGYIIAMDEQIDGTLAFVASGVGLYVISFKEGKPEAVKYTYNYIDSTFNSIVCCPNGHMYFGAPDGIVYDMAPNGSLERIMVSEGEYIVSLSIEDDGNILVGTLNSIFRINASSAEVNRLGFDGVFSINKLANAFGGKVFVATSDKGLWQISAGSDRVTPAAEIYCPFVNLRNSNIGAVYTAADGNVLIGCNFKGVVLVPGEKLPFTYKRISDDFPDFEGGISAMALWGGKVLAALDKGRIALFAANGVMEMNVQIPDGNLVTGIEVMDNGKAYLGVVGDGVWEMDLHTGALRKFIDISGKYPLVVLARGRENELFVGIHGIGLMRYDMNTHQREWLQFEEGSETGFSNPFITYLHRADDDKLWICFYSGLACFDLKKNKMLEVDQIPFLNGTTYTATSSSVGTAWVGTSQGLVHYDLKKGVTKRFTASDGLTDNDVRSIVVDKNDGVWIGSLHGISYLAKDTRKFLAYYGGYGLVENVFNHALYSKANDRIYLGNDLGMTSFRPETVPSPGFTKNIKVSAFYLNGDRIVPETKVGKRRVIEGSQVNPDAIHLPYKSNALTLRMSTMDFRNASNISYMWRLNSGSDWMRTPPGESLIYLPHLDPGVYDFEVCAVENNILSDFTRIKICISFPWYMSFWAKLVYAVIFVAMIVMGWFVFKKKRDEKINDEKIKFFIDISHDLRSPITLILSPLETLLKQQTDPETKSMLGTMHRNVIRMLSLVNQLLDIRKLDKGKMHLHCKLTDVDSFVGEMVEMFRSQAESKKQTIRFEGWNRDTKIWLDRNNFDKILVNLISNAIKYTPAGGCIDVKVSAVDDQRLGECMAVSVTDNGIGLDSKTEAKLFERFYRGDNDYSQATRGFGIGLDLCRRLVDLHHGAISGHNRDDSVKGSVFTVLIPVDERFYKPGELVDGSQAEDSESRKLIKPDPSPAGDGSARTKSLPTGKYILFVDDDEEMRSYVSSQLGKMFKVKLASNGAEALKMVGDKKPDIIISDVVMPEMDGLTLLKRLKSNVDTNDIPVILLSSKVSVADRLSGWDKGADAYLGKPFNIDELELLAAMLIENRLRMKGKYSGAQDTDGKIAAPEMKGNDQALMDRILKEIDEHIEDPEFNVEKLADEVGVSRTHLHRKLKDLIGMTPSDYIRNIRLKRACELLRRGDIEVTQIAYKIGFTSQSHFSTHFKRYTGFSPSEYRSKAGCSDVPGE